MKINRLFSRKYREQEGGEAPAAGSPPAGAPAGGDLSTGNPDPGAIKSFKDLIPQEYASSPGLADYKDMGSFIKSHLELQSLIGSSLRLPKEGDTEAQNKFWEKLGRPQAAEEYKFELDEQFKDKPVNPELDKWFRDTAFKLNLTADQASGLFKEYVALEQAQAAQGKTPEQQAAEWDAQLNEMFGKDRPLKEALAARAGTAFLDQDSVKWLEESGLGDHPQFVKIFAQIGSLLQEDQAFSSNALNSGFAGGAEEARLEIQTLNADKDFMAAYMDRDNPGHQGAVQRMSNLYARAYPGKVKS